jgi:hypothetical protein
VSALKAGSLDMHWQIAGLPVLPERLPIDFRNPGQLGHR